MAIITRSQVIRAPVGKVFDTIADGGNFAAWNPTIRASRRLDSGEIGDGTRFEWDLRGFGKVIQELQEFSRPGRVRIVPRIKTLEGGHRFILTAQGDSTHVDHELEMRPKGAFRLFAPVMGIIGRKNLRDTANALQAHLEKLGQERGPTCDYHCLEVTGRRRSARSCGQPGPRARQRGVRGHAMTRHSQNRPVCARPPTRSGCSRPHGIGDRRPPRVGGAWPAITFCDGCRVGLMELAG